MHYSIKSLMLISILAPILCACRPSSFDLRPAISLHAIPTYPHAQSFNLTTSNDLDEVTIMTFSTRDMAQEVLTFYKTKLWGYRWTSAEEQMDSLEFADISGCPWYSLTVVTKSQNSTQNSVKVQFLTGRCL